MKYIAYYRVSTSRQGESGLGLLAQQESIGNFIRTKNGELVHEYTEIESGKKNNRIALQQAFVHCQTTGATLLVAKLDRLSRNASFLLNLRDSGVSFVALDCPDLNVLTLGILASFAQYEREKISERTKQALQALKKQGVKLGSPQCITIANRNLGVASIKAKAAKNENNIRAMAFIQSYLVGKENIRGIWAQTVSALNSNGFRTAQGKLFKIEQAQRLYRKLST